MNRSARAWPRWARFGVEALALALLYVAVTSWQTRRALGRGEAAPEFSLASADGKTFSLRELHGRPVLLHFWATWCGVCRSELGGLNWIERHLPKDAVLVSVVADAEDQRRIREFVKERGLDYPVLLADEGVIERYRVNAFPTNYYLDRHGQIRQTTVGMSTRFSMWLRLWLVS